MAVAISTLLPDLRVQLPGIPEPLLTGALYRVLRQFFWQSDAWKYTYDNGLDWTLNQIALNTPTAGTDIPAKTVVKRVDEIKYDAGGTDWDEPVEFKTRDELDRENPDWRTEIGTSPQAWTHGNDGVAYILPQVAATVTTSLLVRAVIAPVFTAVTDTLPEFLYYEFEETFKVGILAQLMKIPGKDWTDMTLATTYVAAYVIGINAAKSRSEAGFGQPKDTMAYGGL